MSGILDFDSKILRHLLKKYGLHKAWVSLLATHLNGKEAFKYILNQPEFLDTKIFPRDLLQGLTVGEIGVLYEYSVTYHYLLG